MGKAASIVITIAFALAVAILVGSTVSAQTTSTQTADSGAEEGSPTPLNRFPQMVQNWLVEQAREIQEEGDQKRSTMNSKQDAEQYIADVRAKIAEIFGPWPEKTPLNPRIVGTVERDEYRIEKLIFESRPNFPVTANLYIPKGRDYPLPGVVVTCGHAKKAKVRYQYTAQGLARQGYVVLIYDPIGQAERSQYGRKYGSFWEHMQLGRQQFLVGEFFGAWRAWDGIRALDYLLTRKEVDPSHVGIAGNSGGGTMTTWLCGVEPRFTMAAPSCFVTRFRRLAENEITGSDPEQCPPGALAAGLDELDWLAVMAPKPVILLAQAKDKYFDIRGTISAFEEINKIYTALGVPEQVDLFIGPHQHGYSPETRQAQCEWFDHATGIGGGYTEDDIVLEDEHTLLCAPDGQISKLGSTTVPEFTRRKSLRLAKERPDNIPPTRLRKLVEQSLKIDMASVGEDPYYRIYGKHGLTGRQYPTRAATVYLVETEPGIMAVVYRLTDDRNSYRPPQKPGPAILYVAHESSDKELREEALIGELLENNPDASFYTCDLRGIGESTPKGPADDYFYASNMIMLDKPYVGQRTYDLLRVIAWLKANNHTGIHLVGKGVGALPVTFAAVLSDDIDRVTLKNTLSSYSDVAECADYEWPLSSFVPDVLEHFDLPDCYRALEAKQLEMSATWGPKMKTE